MDIYTDPPCPLSSTSAFITARLTVHTWWLKQKRKGVQLYIWQSYFFVFIYVESESLGDIQSHKENTLAYILLYIYTFNIPRRLAATMNRKKERRKNKKEERKGMWWWWYLHATTTYQPNDRSVYTYKEINIWQKNVSAKKQTS
jgi:hypothetical protein